MDEIKDVMYPDDILRKIQETEPDYEPNSSTNVITLNDRISEEKLVGLNFTEISALNLPPIEWIAHPILPTQGIGWIYAKTGLGKTFFALNLAYAIASGGNFLKYKCPKPRKVLYVDAEVALGNTRQRVLDIANQYGDLEIPENLVILNNDKQVPFLCPSIDDPHGQDVYTKYIEKHQFEVIFFDNLSMLSSFDENKAHEWTPIQQWLLHLRSLGKTVVIVHHAPKTEKGFRGTSKMMDCANMAISLEPWNEDLLEEDNNEAKKIKLVYGKCRDFWGKDALPFEINFENGRFTYQSIEMSIINLIADKLLMGQKSTREIAKDITEETGTKVSHMKVHRLIKKHRMQREENK